MLPSIDYLASYIQDTLQHSFAVVEIAKILNWTVIRHAQRFAQARDKLLVFLGYVELAVDAQQWLQNCLAVRVLFTSSLAVRKNHTQHW
jgi:hypothetical protein